MPIGFQKFDDLSKTLCTAIIAVDMASINALLGNINNSKEISKASATGLLFLILSFLAIVLGLLIGCHKAKDEGMNTSDKIQPRNVNQKLFWYLLSSASLAITGLLIICFSTLLKF